MYQIFGTEQFLRIILYINAFFAVALGSSLGGLITVPYMQAISLSVLLVTTALTILGETPVFPRICRLPLVWHWLPDLDGDYDIHIQSNWPIVSGRANDSDAPTKELLFAKQGTVRITARLLSIRMTLNTADGYSSSNVVVAAVSRERDEPGPVLSYVFKSKIPIPESTDSSEHFGAARIEIPKTREISTLSGSYWTNRNWHNGLNTAGIIKLIRRPS